MGDALVVGADFLEHLQRLAAKRVAAADAAVAEDAVVEQIDGLATVNAKQGRLCGNSFFGQRFSG